MGSDAGLEGSLTCVACNILGKTSQKKLKIWIFSKRGGGSGGSQLESYGSENSHGKMLKIFGVTVWLTEFC